MFGKYIVGVLVGYEQEYYCEDWIKGYWKNFLNNDFWELNVGLFDGQIVDGLVNEYVLCLFFGCLIYDYDNCYLVEVNICCDGILCIFKDLCWGVFLFFFGVW